MEFGSNIAYMLLKMALFVTVQAVVYVILSKSSNVFSKTKRSFSFKMTTPSSIDASHVAAMIADQPAREPSPSSGNWRLLNGERSVVKDLLF
ncbi:hypothetical protein LIER_34436 [Lithospermum erythrorhizon]|uniref:Uncharacterized protein n=1 Tax=Lithospermum erythrorhizon TaxID=34254 RepID=A0AAV3S1D3_LITER